MRILLSPLSGMNLLSQHEVEQLKQSSNSNLYNLFRNCALAVLNVGTESDDSTAAQAKYKDFEINLLSRERGIKIELVNPPTSAFVDGKIIVGIQEHLQAVIRDILYNANRYPNERLAELASGAIITNEVFEMLRNANVVSPTDHPNLVVCWGGHSIKDHEYQYTKEVGYQLGLRKLDICTGCGPGAMKGPMKGAALAHAKQRIDSGRYLGLTEPSIIAAEAPNPIVNELVILPNIEKRLEAFVRVGHAIIIFPGGAGTAEELLYILGIMLHPDNKKQVLPIVLTGPKESISYFEEIANFIELTLGQEALDLIKIIPDDPKQVARYISEKMEDVRVYRKENGDAYQFNWTLKIDQGFQQSFNPSHENMASLDLHINQDKKELAANLRRAFSGIVAGNIKEDGVRSVKEHGQFILDGDAELMLAMDKLLEAFVQQGRMKLPGAKYEPCYKIVT
ncbi:LOG family protein [Psychrosphaera sp. B3R10]|uniref:nucleotide 5'-monophosphate nucleosidase PpnN n=1 Tax=unclassified Psychrosphaera TaxID=2641570 RepID=UPI001C092C29|nr:MULTISPECIES: nucleotide 5'-monophosphate nucleosidase PpnN [unclassified Psychrosphaera]MBU2882371.1 LOG family protein [Psychrosphaera sp. I2R16]MBU2989052.1 LOG family protein [Psychrosphaera sp. B3R10]